MQERCAYCRTVGYLPVRQLREAAAVNKDTHDDWGCILGRRVITAIAINATQHSEQGLSRETGIQFRAQ